MKQTGSSNLKTVDGMPLVSLNDKVKKLLSIKRELVQVQVDELERMRYTTDKTKLGGYINYLYNNYVLLGLPKTYLQ